MTDSSDIKNFFFLGIGGIGMSALARYFHHRGYPVYGYDRTPSPLTRELEQEGIGIFYEDDASFIPAAVGAGRTLVVRTPAVPEDSVVYTALRAGGFDIRKRSEVLGLVTREKKALCVAGTHGKTTTSTMLAHIFASSRPKEEGKGGRDGVNAFLGGISMNYHTNVLIDSGSDYVVVEADEYDRSFLRLTPYMSVVTAVDADHLDIYGTAEAYRDAFAQYTGLITGALVMKHGIALEPRLQPGVKCYTYGVGNDQTVNGPDFYASNIRVGEGTLLFDFHTPEGVIADIRPGVPVWVNIENAVAAMSVAWLVNKEEKIHDPLFADHLKEAVASFKGVQRRFNIHVRTPRLVYIDDYAHHPQEIATAIDSVRRLYPSHRLIGVFQPHLYTRTRDFAEGFAQVLGTLDEVVLLPIYPAREEPIEGVTSEMLLEKIPNPEKRIIQKPELAAYLRGRAAADEEKKVILTVGAGDIDRLVPEITRILKSERED